MFMDNFKFSLKKETFNNLEIFSNILKKDVNTILEEALEAYFKEEQEKLIQKNQQDENMMTNLDYDEFWDGVDID